MASIEGIIRMDFHLLRFSLLYQTAVDDVKTGGQAFQGGAGSLIQQFQSLQIVNRYLIVGVYFCFTDAIHRIFHDLAGLIPGIGGCIEFLSACRYMQRQF